MDSAFARRLETTRLRALPRRPRRPGPGRGVASGGPPGTAVRRPSAVAAAGRRARRFQRPALLRLRPGRARARHVVPAEPARYEIATSGEGAVRASPASARPASSSAVERLRARALLARGLRRRPLPPVRRRDERRGDLRRRAATCSTRSRAPTSATDGGRLVLDFNFAYNPSCSYDPRWICPLAPPANRLPSPSARASASAEADPEWDDASAASGTRCREQLVARGQLDARALLAAPALELVAVDRAPARRRSRGPACARRAARRSPRGRRSAARAAPPRRGPRPGRRTVSSASRLLVPRIPVGPRLIQPTA